MPKSVRMVIYGKVQGVFFRRHIKMQAERLGVRGYVRNLNNEVEAVFEGEESAIEKMISFCKKGPEGAVITKLEINNYKNKKPFDKFEIVYSSAG